jgi:hypothetical protein
MCVLFIRLAQISRRKQTINSRVVFMTTKSDNVDYEHQRHTQRGSETLKLHYLIDSLDFTTWND